MSSTTVKIYNTAYVNMPNAMIAIFSNLTGTPIVGSCSNGTIQYLYQSSSGQYYFTWTPTTTTPIILILLF